MVDDIRTELRKLSPKVTGGLVRMREDTFRDAAIPVKYKVLAALAIVVVEKCEPCIEAYVKMAVEKGATRDELIEFLNVAMTEGGCPGEEWALKAYSYYKQVTTGEDGHEGGSCCV